MTRPASKTSSRTRRPNPKLDGAPGRAWRDEWFLGFSLATAAVFAFSGESIYARLDNPLWLAFVFAWLFGTVMASALNVVRHADHVAEILGEPYGTLVLTLAVSGRLTFAAAARGVLVPGTEHGIVQVGGRDAAAGFLQVRNHRIFGVLGGQKVSARF